MRLQAVDYEAFLYTTGVLGEAGVAWQAAGGNELNVPDDTFDRLTAEQRDELARVLRGSPVAATPPGGDADTSGVTTPEAGTAPPRSGAGATRNAWAAYAAAQGLPVAPGMNRDDIIAMVEQQEAHGGS